MSIQLIKVNEQASGQFNGGEILENKPIGFPREGGLLMPYSNLFYWAHAWSEPGSTIGLHPHQGFEIMSFVTEGSIEHYDTAHKEWRRLDKGAAQIIRAGNGISHSEKINPEGHMFQIWFDPNLNKTIQQPASYNDYPDEVFPVTEVGGVKTKVYRGDGSPLQMESEGVSISEKWIKKGNHRLMLEKENITSIYLVNGSGNINEQKAIKNDFFKIEAETEITVEVENELQIFIISSPKVLTYKTYAENYG